MTLSQEANIRTLTELYAALNRNDIPAVMTAFAPEIEWTEPPHFPSGGTHQGIAAVEALFKAGRATWAEGTCEPERFIPADDKIIVFDRVRVRLHGSTEWLEGTMGAVYTFRNGKAIQTRIFDDRQEALDWVGVEDPGVV